MLLACKEVGILMAEVSSSTILGKWWILMCALGYGLRADINNFLDLMLIGSDNFLFWVQEAKKKTPYAWKETGNKNKARQSYLWQYLVIMGVDVPLSTKSDS